MNVILQVQHSKEYGDVAKGKTFVLSSLFEIEVYKVEITDANEMIHWLSEFTKELKSKINFNEATALSDFKPVLQIAFDFECPYTKEVKHYKMEALLHHIYGLNNAKLNELAMDLFLALSEKWLVFYTECEEKHGA